MSRYMVRCRASVEVLNTWKQVLSSKACWCTVQNPENRYQFNNINWAMAQRAIADDYQRLIWGPAELLNGRMASELFPSSTDHGCSPCY